MTTTSPVMNEWISQKYSYVPASSNVTDTEAPISGMTSEKVPSGILSVPEVTV